MTEEKVVFTSGGNQLAGVINLPSRLPCSVVILLHGGTNTKEDCPLFDRLVPFLNGLGIATFRFDFFGSGESDGLFKEKTVKILDQNIADAVQLVAEDSRFTNIGLFGRSLSGGQVLYWEDEQIKSRVVHSASIHPFDDIRRFYAEEIEDLLAHPEKDMALIVSDPRIVKGEYGYSRTLLDGFKYFPHRAAQSLTKLKNVCIFQGDADPETTVEEAIKLYQKIGGTKELHLIAGANHKYVGSEEEVAWLTARWFKRTLTT